MSKQIDTTKPLSDEDRAYMLSRGREAELARLDAQFETVVDSYEDDDTETEEVAEPYEKWKVEELREEATLRNLDVKPTATKRELVKALEDNDKTTA